MSGVDRNEGEKDIFSLYNAILSIADKIKSDDEIGLLKAFIDLEDTQEELFTNLSGEYKLKLIEFFNLFTQNPENISVNTLNLIQDFFEYFLNSEDLSSIGEIKTESISKAKELLAKLEENPTGDLVIKTSGKTEQVLEIKENLIEKSLKLFKKIISEMKSNFDIPFDKTERKDLSKEIDELIESYENLSFKDKNEFLLEIISLSSLGWMDGIQLQKEVNSKIISRLKENNLEKAKKLLAEVILRHSKTGDYSHKLILKIENIYKVFNKENKDYFSDYFISSIDKYRNSENYRDSSEDFIERLIDIIIEL